MPSPFAREVTPAALPAGAATPPPTPRLLTTLAPFALAQLAILYLFRGFAAEDSYILARYVHNVVHGHGLVYNPGEHVSALTSPAHALIVSALTFVTRLPSATNRGLAVLLLFATEFAALYSFRRRAMAAVLFAAVVLPCPFLNLWSLGGLETIYLMAVVTAVVLLVRRTGAVLSARTALVASVLLGLGFLTRYDAVLFLGPVALYLLYRNPRRALPLILPGLVMSLAWFAFSYWYYHDIFPTSLYIKTPGLTPGRAVGNVAYELHFLALTGAVFLLARPRALRQTLWLLIPLLGVAAYGVSTATTHMFFAYRLFVPYLPALALFLIDTCPPDEAALHRSSFIAQRFSLPLALAANAFTLYWMLNVGIDPRLPFVDADFSPRHRTIAQYNQLMHTFVLNAQDLNRHAAAHPLGRPPRIATFAGGYLPYQCPDDYVFEALVSYRKYAGLQGGYLGRYFPYADYVHIILPLHAPELAAGGATLADFQIVSAHPTVLLDQQQTAYVLYRPSTLPNPLPPYVNDPAPAAPSRLQTTTPALRHSSN